MKKILVTGAAGFIGHAFAKRACMDGHFVHGIDNLNDYYDVALKDARLKDLDACERFTFQKLDLADRDGMAAMFSAFAPDVVVHLAAQAGVRYSIEQPHKYADSNLTGFVNVLEGCRGAKVEHLIFASSSSVYGMNEKIPFSTDDNVDHPISLYAATKKANELMAHAYAHLYGFPCTGLRFFTVYGPWGRPDMAVYKFTDQVQKGQVIDVYNHGDMRRDFTYIDDVVEGVMRLYVKGGEGYRLYNIGHNKPEKLMDLISYIEKALGKAALTNFMPMQAGDVYETYADIDPLIRDTGYAPTTSLREGIERFVTWYRGYDGG